MMTYRDFNNWLLYSDPLAIQKTSWFIAGVMYSLNYYAKKNKKGIQENLILQHPLNLKKPKNF